MNLAVYVIFHVTGLGVGFHHVKSYEYWASHVCTGAAQSYLGVLPYRTFSSTSNVLPSWLFHVTVYVLVLFVKFPVIVRKEEVLLYEREG